MGLREAVLTQLKYSSEVSVEGQKQTHEPCQVLCRSGQNLKWVTLEYNHACSLPSSQNPATEPIITQIYLAVIPALTDQLTNQPTN
jgi:hypothetical protein